MNKKAIELFLADGKNKRTVTIIESLLNGESVIGGSHGISSHTLGISY